MTRLSPAEAVVLALAIEERGRRFYTRSTPEYVKAALALQRKKLVNVTVAPVRWFVDVSATARGQRRMLGAVRRRSAKPRRD